MAQSPMRSSRPRSRPARCAPDTRRRSTGSRRTRCSPPSAQARHPPAGTPLVDPRPRAVPQAVEWRPRGQARALPFTGAMGVVWAIRGGIAALLAGAFLLLIARRRRDDDDPQTAL